MFKIILLLITITGRILASENIELLANQPIAAQVGGSCYAYAGNELLTGAYAKNNKIKESVTAPHPLLVAAFGQKQLKEGFVSGGNACDYINEAKEINNEICSYDGLESYFALKNDETKKGENYFQEQIKKFDDALMQLVADLDVEDIGQIKTNVVKNDLDDLKKNLCEMSAIGNDSTEIDGLVKFAQEIVDNFKNESKRNAFDRFHDIGVRLLSGQKFSDATMALKVRDETQKQLKGNLAPLFLRKFYEKLNAECIKKQKELDLPAVPVDFFTNSKKINCDSWMYYKKNLSENEANKIVQDIELQLKNGYPTPIGFCGMIFEGKSKAVGKDEKTGKCVSKNDAHFLTVVGFKNDSDGVKRYKIKNSWGYNQCELFDYNVRNCEMKSLKNCPDRKKEINCEDGYYYVTESFIKNQIINYIHVEGR